MQVITKTTLFYGPSPTLNDVEQCCNGKEGSNKVRLLLKNDQLMEHFLIFFSFTVQIFNGVVNVVLMLRNHSTKKRKKGKKTHYTVMQVITRASLSHGHS